MRQICLVLLLVVSFASCKQSADKSGSYNIDPVPFIKVKVVDNFWAKRIKTNSEVTIPIAYNHCEKTGRIDNFKIAGGIMEGEFQTSLPFDDSDVFKIIEG